MRRVCWWMQRCLCVWASISIEREKKRDREIEKGSEENDPMKKERKRGTTIKDMILIVNIWSYHRVRYAPPNAKRPTENTNQNPSSSSSPVKVANHIRVQFIYTLVHSLFLLSQQRLILFVSFTSHSWKRWIKIHGNMC